MATVRMLCKKTDSAVVPAIDDNGLVKDPFPLLTPVAEADEAMVIVTPGL